MRADILAFRRRAWWFAFAAVGCTSILSIDGKYVAVTGSGGEPSGTLDAGAGGVDSGTFDTGGTVSSGGASSGGTSSGGAVIASGGVEPAAGGTMPAAGGALTSGAAGSGAVASMDCTASGCAKGQKCCGSPATTGTSCYVPSPLVGCDDSECSYCSDPVPTHATASCSTGKCSFTCDQGYSESSGACVAMGTGGKSSTSGSGGSGGSGQSGPECEVDSDCSLNCGAAGPFPCCMPNAICGCTFFNLKLGNAPAIGYCLPRTLPIPIP